MQLYKTYIIHSPDLNDREKNVENIKGVFNGEVIDKYSHKNVTDEMMNSIVYEKKGNKYDSMLSPLNKYQVSNISNHIEAFRKAVESKDKYEYFLFLEDDCLFDISSILKNLSEYIKIFKETPFEVFFLNLKTNNQSKTPTVQGINTDELIIPLTNAYIVRSSVVEKIYKEIQTIRYKYNVQLSYAILTSKVMSAITTECLFIDGSKFGPFLTYIEDNTTMPLNPEWMAMFNALYKGKEGQIDVKAIENKLESFTFKNHPATLHLLALLHMKFKKNYALAKKYYDESYKMLVDNNFVVNGSTQMMKTYTEIFKHFQDINL